MAKAKDKDATLFSVFFAAFMSLLLGLTLAVYTLATRQPITITKSLKPEEVKRNTVYYFQPPNKGKSNWSAARDWLIAGNKSGVLTLSELDLNAWATKKLITPDAKPRLSADNSTPAPDPKKKPSERPSKGPAPMVPDGINFSTMQVFAQNTSFKLSDDSMTIGSRLFIPPLVILKGSDITIPTQITGKFARIENHLRFVPNKMIIGSCPVPKDLIPYIFERLIGCSSNAKEYAAIEPTWEKLSNATIENGALLLTLN